MTVAIRDVTSGNTHYLPGNTPCVYWPDLSERERQTVVDGGGISDRSGVDLDEIDELPAFIDREKHSGTLDGCGTGEECLIYDADTNVWWHSEVL